jgi:hypothetical protein
VLVRRAVVAPGPLPRSARRPADDEGVEVGRVHDPRAHGHLTRGVDDDRGGQLGVGVTIGLRPEQPPVVDRPFEKDEVRVGDADHHPARDVDGLPVRGQSCLACVVVSARPRPGPRPELGRSAVLREADVRCAGRAHERACDEAGATRQGDHVGPFLRERAATGQGRRPGRGRQPVEDDRSRSCHGRRRQDKDGGGDHQHEDGQPACGRAVVSMRAFHDPSHVVPKDPRWRPPCAPSALSSVRLPEVKR